MAISRRPPSSAATALDVRCPYPSSSSIVVLLVRRRDHPSSSSAVAVLGFLLMSDYFHVR